MGLAGKIVSIDPLYGLPGGEVAIDCVGLDTSEPATCSVWFDEVQASIVALGPKRIKNFYSRFATKYFGLRAARWFAGTNDGHSCNNCQSNTQHEKPRF